MYCRTVYLNVDYWIDNQAKTLNSSARWGNKQRLSNCSVSRVKCDWSGLRTCSFILVEHPGCCSQGQFVSSSGFWHDYDVVGKSSNRAKSGHNPGGEENAEVGVIAASCERQPCNSTADCKLQRCEAGRREQNVWLQSEPTPPLITGWRSVLLQGWCHRRRVAAAQKTPKHRPPSASGGDPSVFRLAFDLSV